MYCSHTTNSSTKVGCHYLVEIRIKVNKMMKGDEKLPEQNNSTDDATLDCLAKDVTN